MLYVAFRGEVDTYPIAGRLISDGKVVCLPRTDVSGQTITPAFWDGRQASLVRGAYGILEPSAEVEVFSPLEIDMVLVPALAFDRSGYRLGYGGGYYDRFLPRCRPDALTAGVGFDWQVLDSVPHEPHDIPLKALITPSGWRVAECPAG
jgi:5-formyltetrahydrofolate cyclo-ligase